METITQKILHWHDLNGRKDLPWQNTRDAYRIWLSEIMLQQTQVATVIPYYQRFTEQFPNITSLANAPLDEVLHQWTGLGYYARARNLHKTATLIKNNYQGKFPTDFEQVLALPGIGKSTAGAVLAFSQNQRHPILDGNVKRVLSRFYAIEGWYGHSSVEKQLWVLADKNTPTKNVAQYTQAIMDFGATLCTRSKPNCSDCPLTSNCIAFKHNRQNELPHSKPKKTKPVRSTNLLLIQNQYNEILLEQRPPSGIWGGLWCPPEIQIADDKKLTFQGAPLINIRKLSPIKHIFSHFQLNITPILGEILGEFDTQSLQHTEPASMPISEQVNETPNQIWYNPNSPAQVGLAAPVKKLLEQLPTS